MTPIATLKPGTRVRVVQTMDRRAGAWQTEVQGVVVSYDIRKTGSWYAHGRNGRLWLQRLTLRKDDGEEVRLSLDERSQITVLAAEAAQSPR